MRILATMLLIIGATCMTGCASLRGLQDNLTYCDAMNDFVMDWRNTAWARQAWHDRKYMYVDEPQFITFGEGFRDGYADVASGANGCVPAIPPRKYWTWKYQTGEGQAKVAAWFAGYPHGAAAAKEDGAGNFQQIQVSHLIEAEYSPEFRAGKCPNCGPNFMPIGPEMESLPPGEYPNLHMTPTPMTPAPRLPPPIENPTTQVMPGPSWPTEANRLQSPGHDSPDVTAGNASSVVQFPLLVQSSGFATTEQP